MIFRGTKSEVYAPKTYIYQYNDNDFRLVHLKAVRISGWENLEQDKQVGIIPQTDSEEIQRISLSRSKRNIRELALCNDFEYFATVTVDNQFCDRFHLEQCQTLLRKKFKKIKRSHKEFAYLFITEKHKDGAFHFHGLVKGLDLYVNDNGYFSNTVFDEIGFNSFSKIKDYTKCCNYITKYITKDCVKNEHNQIYFCSKGLKKAQKEELKNFTFEPSYENDFVQIRDISLNNEKDKQIVYNLLTNYSNNVYNELD